VAYRTRSHGQVLGYWHIDAVPGSITPGSGDAGAMGYGGAFDGTKVARPAQSIAGEVGDVDAVFGSRGRFVNA
jgi:hypothetical protein